MKCTQSAELDDLLRRAKAKFDAMTPEQQDEMFRQQRESWVRGEIGIGSDANEAAYRDQMRREGRL